MTHIDNLSEQDDNLPEQDDDFMIDEELPVPEADDKLLDLSFIHWGYLNCCLTRSNGKKVKKPVWNTYWVDLCGSTFRMYKDSSLPPDSSLYPPPVSQFGILQENEAKAGFFDLDGGNVSICEDGLVIGKKPRKGPKVYRRHMFQVVFHKIRSSYVFQTTSHSSLLRWVSKIQECIEATANDQISQLVEERLQLAHDMMEKSYSDAVQIDSKDNEIADDESETVSIYSETSKVKDDSSFSHLKRQLREKQDLLWQIEHQIIDFLGNKGDFKRLEFTCPIKQDYYLVAGRMETYIPAGTNVTIFGQLPNRRWRCLIEMDDLIHSMNTLVKDLQSSPCKEKDESDGREMRLDRQPISRNNLPDYPLIGCLPESVLDYNFNYENNLLSIASPVNSADELIDEEEEEEEILSPYSTHKRKSRSSSMKSREAVPSSKFVDAAMESIASQESGGTILSSDNGSVSSEAQSETNPRSSVGSDSDSDSDDENEQIIISNTNENDFVRLNGFLLRKKLRQKGLSIVVGSSSSSEDEDEDCQEDKHQEISNNVYRKFTTSNRPDKNDNYEAWNAEDNSYIRTKVNRERLKSSYSTDNVSSKEEKEFTTKPDLLKRFGQRSINFSHDKDKPLWKELNQFFDHKEKGPDVKPPRNERRTLKLSKSNEQGFGFWLQTYGFGRQKNSVAKRTFVRYVEDEGPAYLAGLREGDIIVEVDGMNVERIEHMKIVELITQAKKQLILVVKFMDAVHRVELEVRLKKKEAKLRAKKDELRRIDEERKVLLETVSSPSSPDSYQELDEIKDDDIDRVSLNTLSESELSSMSSLSSEEVIVRTSKFERRSSRVLDSIKELNCCDLKSTIDPSNMVLTSTTTDNDLMNLYADTFDGYETLGRCRIQSSGLKRVETMPVQKYRTLPRYKAVIDLDGNYAREYSIETSMPGDILNRIDAIYAQPSSIDSINNESETDEKEDSSDEDKIGLSRKNRQSYKLAMKMKFKENDPLNF